MRGCSSSTASRWEYEPRTFPLRWDDEGRVVEAVTPDFYLVDLDLYLEITTMRQAHVTRKARKLRELAERYPEVRVKLFVRRDIERLARRHGIADEVRRVTGRGPAAVGQAPALLDATAIALRVRTVRRLAGTTPTATSCCWRCCRRAARSPRRSRAASRVRHDLDAIADLPVRRERARAAQVTRAPAVAIARPRPSSSSTPSPTRA